MNKIILSGIFTVFLIITLLTQLSFTQDKQEIKTIDSWGDIAIDDLHFIRATLRQNHAGPADKQNPWFRDWYEKGFAEALDLAKQAKDYAGYHFSIQYYMEGFQDGHLGALGEELLKVSQLQFRWPGFVTGYKSDQFIIVESDNSDLPIGSILISSDKRSAEQLGKTILQKYYGLWSVPGARSAIAPLLFVDTGNPFIQLPDKTTWRVNGKDRTIELEWRSIESKILYEKVRNARKQISPPFEIRRFADSTGYWISLPSFSMRSKKVQKGIDTVLTVLKTEGDQIRSSDIIVFDVRGNGGGSSSLGDEIVETLWGEAVLDEVQPKGVYTDWRVSKGNASFLRRVNLSRMAKRYGEDDVRVQSYQKFIEDMEEAVSQGEIYLRRGGKAKSTATNEEPITEGIRHKVTAKVFFLTDHACFSAALDFADLMRHIPGVLHIGLETRADAIYIDNRGVHLPSGFGMLGFSMKVYRNRPRGHNESYVPQRMWQGDITDTAALEKWVLKLAREQMH
jgi:hypothetical protein